MTSRFAGNTRVGLKLTTASTTLGIPADVEPFRRRPFPVLPHAMASVIVAGCSQTSDARTQGTSHQSLPSWRAMRLLRNCWSSHDIQSTRWIP
jgi:hypothetical protein